MESIRKIWRESKVLFWVLLGVVLIAGAYLIKFANSLTTQRTYGKKEVKVKDLGVDRTDHLYEAEEKNEKLDKEWKEYSPSSDDLDDLVERARHYIGERKRTSRE